LDRRISADFPCFTLDNCKLKFVSQFRYLGHIINDNLMDDDDTKREITKLFVNTLVNRVQRCSHNVKLVLFKSFCMCMYDLALLKYHTVTVYNKFKSAYNKCIKKKLFGFASRDSMTGIFMYLSVPTTDTIVYNARILFVNQCAASCDMIVRWFADIDV